MLPKKTCLLFFGFFLLFYANFQSTQAQQWRWAINGSGNNQNSNADRDIAVDNDGTQFIAGYFIDTLSLGSFTRLRANTGMDFRFYNRKRILEAKSLFDNKCRVRKSIKRIKIIPGELMKPFSLNGDLTYRLWIKYLHPKEYGSLPYFLYCLMPISV